MRSVRSVLWGALAILCVPVAQAQEGPATGFAFWTLISESNLTGLFGVTSTAIGSPQFVVGYQSSGFSLGLGIGVSKASDTDTDTGGESKSTVTSWQIGPSALINFWHSPDRMSRGNVVLEATYGKISISDKFTPAGGTASEQKGSGKVLGVRLGVGGDHFFGEHFGLGAEIGFEGTFVQDFEFDGSTGSEDLSITGAYGALRVTVAL